MTERRFTSEVIKLIQKCNHHLSIVVVTSKVNKVNFHFHPITIENPLSKIKNLDRKRFFRILIFLQKY